MNINTHQSITFDINDFPAGYFPVMDAFELEWPLVHHFRFQPNFVFLEYRIWGKLSTKGIINGDRGDVLITGINSSFS